MQRLEEAQLCLVFNIMSFGKIKVYYDHLLEQTEVNDKHYASDNCQLYWIQVVKAVLRNK